MGALAAIGSNWLYFKVARGEPATIGDAFAGFGVASGFLGAMFLWILLETLLVFLGLLLLIVPGLFLSMILWVQPRAMIDERLSATQTISRGWELATANLWIARDGVAMTPVCNGTFLNGITRQRVIQLLRDDGTEVRETTLTRQDIVEADEAFSTGNYGKVLPITRVEDRHYQTGRVYQKARARYLEFARSQPAG